MGRTQRRCTAGPCPTLATRPGRFESIFSLLRQLDLGQNGLQTFRTHIFSCLLRIFHAFTYVVIETIWEGLALCRFQGDHVLSLGRHHVHQWCNISPRLVIVALQSGDRIKKLLIAEILVSQTTLHFFGHQSVGIRAITFILTEFILIKIPLQMSLRRPKLLERLLEYLTPKSR